MFFFAVISYSQFFTLTEKADVLSTQRSMLNQSSQVSNGKAIAKYLNENKPTVRMPTDKENAEALAKQQAKSKELAKQIENKQGEK